MAAHDAPSQQSEREGTSLDLNFELRRVISTALAAVQGRQTSESFYAITYEELADQQIERIEGKGTEARPNEYERIDRIEQDLLNAVEQIRSIPPEQFLLSDGFRDVNTPAEVDDT